MNRIWKLGKAHEKSYISDWTESEGGALVNDTEVGDEYSYTKPREQNVFRKKPPRHLNEMIEVFANGVLGNCGQH
jgi:hypothetical protein